MQQGAFVLQPETDNDPQINVNLPPTGGGMNIGVQPDLSEIANHAEAQHIPQPAAQQPPAPPPMQQPPQHYDNSFVGQPPPPWSGAQPNVPPSYYNNANPWPQQHGPSVVIEEEGSNSYAPSPGFLSLDDERSDLILKFKRIRTKGMPVRDFAMHDDILEMRSEYKRLQNECDMEISMDYSRKMLLAIVGTMEVLNKKYDPFDLYLNGWCDSVSSNIGKYDNVLERLYYKWRNRVTVSPEIELMLSLAGSAFMFHMTSQWLKPTLQGGGERSGDFMHNMIRAFSGAPPARPQTPAPHQQPGPPPQAHAQPQPQPYQMPQPSRMPQPMSQPMARPPFQSAYEMKGPAINLFGQNTPLAPPAAAQGGPPAPVSGRAPTPVIIAEHRVPEEQDSGLSNRITEIEESIGSTQQTPEDSVVSTPPKAGRGGRGRGRPPGPGRGRGRGRNGGRANTRTPANPENSIDVDSD